ncbi:MAG: hypothetical protein ACQKBV_08815 [Puniceicoccales bacterium]
MFSFRAEKEEIAAVKARIAAEREILGREIALILPNAKKAAVVGGTAFALKKAAPILRPLAFGLLQRSLAKRGKFHLLKMVGLTALGFGAWRFLSGGEE